MIFTESPRDKTPIRYLGYQAFDGPPKFLQHAYKLATENTKYGYIVISCDPGRNPLLRVASKLFQPPINIYIEKKCSKMNESAAKCMYLVDPDMYNNILGITSTSHKLITKKKLIMASFIMDLLSKIIQIFNIKRYTKTLNQIIKTPKNPDLPVIVTNQDHMIQPSNQISLLTHQNDSKNPDHIIQPSNQISLPTHQIDSEA